MNLYCVVGNPIAQSLSPDLHRLFAEQTGEAIQYDKVLIELDDFDRHMRALIEQGYRGFNITAPFKENAYQLVDVAAGDTHLAGALNTIKVEENGALSGFSTDGIGLVRDIENNLGVKLNAKNVLLLGAGGAAKSVAMNLVDAGSQLTIANRTAAKAHAIAEKIGAEGVGFDEIKGYFDVVINATSASLSDDALVLSTSIIDQSSLCYEMAYNKGETQFQQWAQQAGTPYSDGLGMLVEQGAVSFEIWRGVMPETQSVLSSLREKF